MKLEKIPIKDMSREDWLEHRKTGIGGSDAAAIVGLNSYSTPYSVWADKTGRTPPRPDNEAMRQGRDFEDYVAKRWEEATGKKVRRENYILRNPKYPFALANIDRRVVGENAGLECKTTSLMNLKKFKNGEFPANYYVQCMHYMAVTGAERWYLAVLVLNQEFYEFTIERDEDEIAELMRMEKEFYQHIETDTPPPVDGCNPTTDTLVTLHNRSTDGSVELFGRNGLIDDYTRLKEEISVLEKQAERIKQQLMEDLGDNELGFTDDYKISWKSQTRRTFQAKDFEKANPDLDLTEYYKVTNSRVFRITKTKKEK